VGATYFFPFTVKNHGGKTDDTVHLLDHGDTSSTILEESGETSSEKSGKSYIN
jgi:hypothetical protein